MKPNTNPTHSAISLTVKNNFQILSASITLYRLLLSINLMLN